MEAATVPEQQSGEEKPRRERVMNHYRILMETDSELWRSLGTVEAFGIGHARREAIKEFGLEDQVRNGGVTLVVVADRFWRPAGSRIETSEKIEFE